MYIQVTIDLKNYSGDRFDLRLSNYHSIKHVIEIVWEIQRFSTPPRNGHWVKVSNKRKVLPGYVTLAMSGVTNGDKLEII